MKYLLPSCLLIVIITNAQAQIYVRQTGLVAYSGSVIHTDTVTMDAYSKSLNTFIKEMHGKRNLPLIYISIGENTVLSFDNLNGNSLDNKAYDRNGKYDKPGIRIVISNTSQTPERNMLKLLDYGIENLSELKKERKKALKLEYYDQPDQLNLKEEKLQNLLVKENAKVEAFLKKG